MPKSWIWTGSISFGLVNVPVALVTAERDHDFRFRELHGEDRAPVVRKRFCSEEDVEVPREEIGRGYELSGGEMVLLTPAELEAVAPERTKTIEIESFTDLELIDPILFDHNYHVVPSGKSEGDLRAYRLLTEAMGGAGQAAIGRFVMRTREYLVAIREREGVLAMTTLLFADEVRPVEDVPVGDAEAPERLVDEAVAVIEELSTDWNPESYEDCYRERLAKVIKDKKRGRRVHAPTPVEEVAGRPTAAPDLMAALKKTLDEARGRSRTGKGSGKGRSRSRGLERMSRDQLYQRAQELELPGRSKMSKEELREAIEAGKSTR